MIYYPGCQISCWSRRSLRGVWDWDSGGETPGSEICRADVFCVEWGDRSVREPNYHGGCCGILDSRMVSEGVIVGIEGGSTVQIVPECRVCISRDIELDFSKQKVENNYITTLSYATSPLILNH